MAESTDFKYWPINWVDGMLLNKDLLSHQDSLYSERISDAIHTGLNPFNYGILKRLQSTENCIVNVSVDNRSSLKIHIQKCLAITSGGVRISIPGADWKLDEISIDLNEVSGYSDDKKQGQFYVVLTVNPASFIECGTPNAEEEPQRYPFCRPDYGISIIPVKTLDKAGPGSHALPIALLSIQNGELRQVESYLPPCTMVESHTELIAFSEQLQLNLRSLENSAITIIQKVRSKHQENMLALGINSLAEQILNSCSSLLSYLNIQAKWNPVIEILTRVSSTARSIKNTLDSWQGIGKEEVLNYLAEWCNLNQGEFEKHLNDLIGMNYKHQDMMLSLKVCQDFFNNLTPVFTILADLDYIGKKIDTDLFVKEDVIKFEEETVKSKKGGLFRK